MSGHVGILQDANDRSKITERFFKTHVRRLNSRFPLHMPDWLDYQLLAAEIYRDLSPGATVTHDDSIVGRNSGVSRQIDVSIRTDVAGHPILVIVQAKHLKRRADINIVGEFKAVVDDVGAAKGVLICSGGFSKNAIQLANSLSIDLCTAHDAKSRKWALDLRIPLLWIEPVVDFQLEFALRSDRNYEKAAEFASDAGLWLVSRDHGKTSQSIAEILCSLWDARETARAPNQEHRLQNDTTNLRLRVADDFWCPIEHLAFVYTIRTDAWKGTFTFSQSRGIINVNTSTLNARIRLTDRDIPLVRDPSWERVSDLRAFEVAHPNLMRIEKSTPRPQSLSVEHAQISADE
jgi:Restriction endonuclease